MNVTLDPIDDWQQRDALQLRKAHYEVLARFATSRGCTVDEARYLANDALAELEVRRRSSGAQSIDNVRNWLIGVVHNSIKKLLRDRSRCKPLSDEAQLALVANGGDPQKYAEFVEVLDAIRKLPERQTVAITLSMQGFTIAEIAEVIGCTRGNAKQIICRARKTLRRMLGE
jgi:RNA polymerase sigma-70 factor (ECF subfamily)